VWHLPAVGELAAVLVADIHPVDAAPWDLVVIRCATCREPDAADGQDGPDDEHGDRRVAPGV
jgi:hypothetical protein